MKYIQLTILLFTFLCELEAQRPIQRIANTVGLISFDDKTKPGQGNFGTGTLIAKRFSDKDGLIFLVTNKHVLPIKAQSDSIHFKLRDTRSSTLSYFHLVISIYDKTGAFSETVRIDPDGNDLAVINVSKFFNAHKELGYLVKEMFTTSLLVQRDSMEREQIQIGDDVIFIGYPNILYDERNFSPIARTGIIASEPSDDYYFSEIYRSNYFIKSRYLIPEKLTGFLIDANVFQGSSGSIVFTRPKRLKILPDGRTKIFAGLEGEIRVLGIISTSYFDFNSLMGDRLQLGGVICGDQIVKTMDLFLPIEK